MNGIFRGMALCAMLLGLGAPASRAQQPMSPAQALAYSRVGDLQFSPDGLKLAYVALSYRWDYRSRLRILDLASGNVQELTPADKSERSPQWSADGKWLGFLSNRGGKTQVYRISAQGGEPTALTACKYGVEKFHWSPDGRTIGYLAKEDSAAEQDSGPQVADAPGNLARLWVLELASKATRSLGTAGFGIDDFQWRDATHLLVAATDRPRVERFTDAIFILATAGGGFIRVSQPPQPFGGLLISPDGREFAIRSTGANGPIARDAFVGKIGAAVLRNISAPPGLAVADMKWHEQSSVWLRVIDGFYNRIVRVTPGGAAVTVDLPLSVASFDVTREGVVAFVGEDFQHLPQLYLKAGDGSIRQIGQAQEGAEAIQLASTAIFTTRSFDGTDIQAALIRPSALPPSEKLPLVLLVHGGPSSNFSAGYGWVTAWAQFLASHGYQILMVNPRGSNGYSEDFVKANRGDWGGGDYQDLMAVLDAVIAKGGTDPLRLGVGGWSYGGEMSAWAITQSGRFKAAVDGAGVFDQQAEFETEDSPAGDEWYFGTPWEQPEVFARNSPATFIRNAHTPTLIFDGEDDASNPVGQSKGLYRALKHFGVETEMVLYPGEGHSPRRGSYNIDMFERILAWYDRYLGKGD